MVTLDLHSVKNNFILFPMLPTPTKRLQLAEQRLDESLQATHLLECQVQAQREQLCYVVGGIQSVSKAQGSCTTAFNQAMTRLASYENRLSMMNGRINMVKG